MTSTINFISQLGLSSTDVELITSEISLGKPSSIIGIRVLCTCLPSISHKPDTTEYIKIQQSHWSLRARLPYSLILTPTTTSQISLALQILSHFSLPFSLRSGGHTPFPQSSLILLSLSSFTTLSLSPCRSLITIGPGLRWSDVYHHLTPHGLACLGGRVPTVGVGGLLLGGGLTPYTNRYGMACDMVHSFSIVLATGEVITASAEKNMDLFRALKGGGGNFGVVTGFTLYIIPQLNGLWGGGMMYGIEKYGECLEALVEWQEMQDEDRDTYLVCNFMFADEGRQQGCGNLVFSSGEGDNPQSLERWREIGPVVDMTKRVGLDMLIDGNLQDFPALKEEIRREFRTVAMGVDRVLYHAVLRRWKETCQAVAAISGFSAFLSWQPISEGIVQAGKVRGGNCLGIEERAQVWLCLLMSWRDEEDDEVVIEAGRKFVEDVRRMSIERGYGVEFLYLNDAAGDQGVIESYGEESVEFLKRLAERVDPEGVFQRLCKGGFKLPG